MEKRLGSSLNRVKEMGSWKGRLQALGKLLVSCLSMQGM